MPYSNHPEYQKNRYVWGYVRDAMSGESAVKRLNTRYLPMPSAMLALPNSPTSVNAGTQHTQSDLIPDDLSVSDLPFYHPNPAYMAYLQRARYPMLVAHTIRAFTGIAMRKEPTIELPEDMEYLRENLLDVFRRTVSNALGYGRLWLVVDYDEEKDQVRILTYKALSGVDWEPDEYVIFQEFTKKKSDNHTGRKLCKLCLRVVNTDGMPYDPDNEDEEAAHDQNAVYVVLKDEKGDGDFDAAEFSVPEIQGKPLHRLPVVCCGSIDLDWNTDPIPVEGILGCASQIYMKNADLSQSEVMSCNPLLILLGLDRDDTPTVVGSTIAITLPSKEECDAKYIEPQGAALEHMRETIQDLHGEAAEYGAQLLGASKSQVESGDALRLRQNASGASLLSVMQLGAKAVDKCLDIIAEWTGRDRNLFAFSYDSDLAEVTLSPQELSALTQTWMSGGISYESYFDRLQQAGIVPDDRTAEEERALIEQEAPSFVLPSQNNPPDESGNDPNAMETP
ncbi:MAG: DUF4055 domain-containing protein [Synergistaceae bacterium]